MTKRIASILIVVAVVAGSPAKDAPEDLVFSWHITGKGIDRTVKYTCTSTHRLPTLQRGVDTDSEHWTREYSGQCHTT